MPQESPSLLEGPELNQFELGAFLQGLEDRREKDIGSGRNESTAKMNLGLRERSMSQPGQCSSSYACIRGQTGMKNGTAESRLDAQLNCIDGYLRSLVEGRAKAEEDDDTLVGEVAQNGDVVASALGKNLEEALPGLTPQICCKKKSESEEKSTCIICFGGFGGKHPAIKVPCAQGCNDAPVHAKCIFEWTETRRNTPQPSTCPLCRGPLNPVSYTPPDPLNVSSLVMFECRKSFVTRPVPIAAGVIRCFVKVFREEGVLDKPIRYELYLQAPVTARYPNGPLPSLDSPQEKDQLLLVAKRRSGSLLGGKSVNPRSIVDMSLNERDFTRRGVNFVGCVKSSISGLEHVILAPYNTYDALVPGRNFFYNNKVPYREIAAVKYTQNRIGRSVGPRRMQVAVPKVVPDVTAVEGDESSISRQQQAGFPQEECCEANQHPEDDFDLDEDLESHKWSTCMHRPARASQAMRSRLRKGSMEANSDNRPGSTSVTDGTNTRKNSSQGDLLFGYNKQPYWLDSIQAYSLDFSSRVTLPSNKNFQLVLEGNPLAQHERTSSTSPAAIAAAAAAARSVAARANAPTHDITLQFGKVNEGTTEIYTMDVQWPLSPVQAFGLCISACVQKLACA